MLENMKAVVTFVGGMLALAAIFVAILGFALTAAMLCLRMTGLAISYRQAAWILAALWCLWAGARLFGATFAWLQKRGNEQRQRASSFAERHVAPSPIHRFMN